MKFGDDEGLGGRSWRSMFGKLAMYCWIWPSWFGIEVAGLDEGHQAGGDGREDERRERDRAEQEPVAQQVAPLLDEDGPDHASLMRSLLIG